MKSKDEHLRLCVHFVLMSGDFIEFVSAYRTQDSITVESGFAVFAPQWKMLGHMKYLEAHWEQHECLFKNFPYSCLQEARMNQCMQTYHGSSGKSSIAHDEWLELTNKDFAGRPTVCTLEGMMHQGAYLGMIQQCKHAVEVIYSAGAMN